MKRLMICAAIAVLSSGNVVRAESESLDFGTLLSEALTSSPEAARIDATLAERVADAFATRVKSNPELSSSFEFPSTRRGGEKTERAVSLSQSIRLSDFGDRGVLAAIIEQTADVDKQIALNEYVQNLGVLYARAWQYQEIGSLLADARKRAAQFLNKVEDGAKRGIFSEGDVELFRAEENTFEADGIAAKADYSKTVAELTRASGVALEGRHLKKLADSFQVERGELELLVRESGLPIQKRVRLLKNLATKQLEVARLDSFPAISPSVGYSHHDDGIDQFTVGITIPLPVFDRNQSERIRAQGALAAASQAERYATSDALVQEVQLTYDVLQSIKGQVDLFESKVIPARKKAIDVFYRQFDAGIGSALPLWQALRELNASQLRALELRTALAGARAQIGALTGKLL